MRALRPRDAAVTGLGIVSVLGATTDATWSGLVEGRRGIVQVGAPTDPPGTRWAALVEPPYLRVALPDEIMSQSKFLNATGEMAVTATAEAVAQAGIAGARVPPERRSLYLAQGDTLRTDCFEYRVAVAEATGDFHRPIDAEAVNRATMSRMKPWFMLETILNNAFSLLTAWQECRGANTSLSGHSSAGLLTFGGAARAVLDGQADETFCVGAGRMIGGNVRHELDALGVSTRGREGADSCRPLDRRRDGLVPAEGAASILLEPLESVRARGGTPLAVVLGQGASTGHAEPVSFGPVAATLETAARQALAEAGVRPGELLGVVVPGIATPAGDREVLEASRRVLEGHDVPVSAWKGALGYACCANDVIEAALAVRALGTGVFPGTTGFDQPEPGYESLRIHRTGFRRSGDAVLILAGSPAGQAAAVCLGRA